MKMVKKGKVNYLQPSWATAAGLQAGFTTRNGGVSRAPYNSLNLAFNTEDLKTSVEGNRSTLARALEVPAHLMLTVNQVHGNNILVVDEPNPDLTHFLGVECDAVVTDQPGILIGILTADCYPVLLADPKRKVYAAVHVGWRGAASGLLAKTLTVLEKQFEVRPEQLLAATGPGIGAHKYEVDRPVRDAFQKGSGHWDRIAKEVSLGKWQLDLRRSAELQLRQAGLDPKNIEAVPECTCCHKELFFSYRRDEGVTGRQMGFVVTG